MLMRSSKTHKVDFQLRVRYEFLLWMKMTGAFIFDQLKLNIEKISNVVEVCKSGKK